MKKTLILIVAIISTVTGCTKQKGIQQNHNINQQQPYSQKLESEVNLSKSDTTNVDENINGYEIADDLRISLNRGEGLNISYPFQKLRTQILTKDNPKNVAILEKYQHILPKGIKKETQYSFYDLSYNYFLITAESGTEVRDNPVNKSSIVDKLENFDKVSLLERVQGDVLDNSNIWYKVIFNKGNELKEGYVHSSTGIQRRFQFDKMNDSINALIGELNQGELHIISNYKNRNGTPPKLGNNAAVDKFGYRAYHSAPAYTQANTNSDFRYIPDGILIRVLDQTDEFYHVYVPTFKSNFYVPKQYIDLNNKLIQLRKVIVVDRNQQNEASFEIDEDGLRLVSSIQATTGLPGDFSYETTLGSYKVVEKKDRFLYLKKGSDEIAGYAPYAIRFTGGAYIHGVPVEYKKENGEMIDPGKKEYLHTIGTFPRSSMCVRNYTSHAEFLYNWMDSETGAVIVIE